MEHRLLSISRAIAQSAIAAYVGRAAFTYQVDSAVPRVYEELVIGAKCKSSTYKLARTLTKAAICAYWKNTQAYVDHIRLANMENEATFHRAFMASHATLKKMIRETNNQRRLHLVLSH